MSKRYPVPRSQDWVITRVDPIFPGGNLCTGEIRYEAAPLVDTRTGHHYEYGWQRATVVAIVWDDGNGNELMMTMRGKAKGETAHHAIDRWVNDVVLYLKLGKVDKALGVKAQ